MNSNEKLKILVVDDERSNIDALTFILKPTYTVLVAKDGRTAIEVAHNNIPDLILLDVVMPDISGFEVLTTLKESDTTRSIPIIFITGRDNAEDEERGFTLGAVDYITKPFHNSIIKARIQTQLQMREYIRTIERLGMIDALTNIPNRRSFDAQLKKEWERAIREKTSISVLMMDIDDFKKYNDTHGHTQGDVLLRTVARIFEQSLKRPADFVARWGGEEFIILLPNTDSKGSLAVAEQVRAQIEKTIIPRNDGLQTNVTISIGVNAETPHLGSSMEDFITGADKALYKAKENGKNRVCFFFGSVGW